MSRQYTVHVTNSYTQHICMYICAYVVRSGLVSMLSSPLHSMPLLFFLIVALWLTGII